VVIVTCIDKVSARQFGLVVSVSSLLFKQVIDAGMGFSFQEGKADYFA